MCSDVTVVEICVRVKWHVGRYVCVCVCVCIDIYICVDSLIYRQIDIDRCIEIQR